MYSILYFIYSHHKHFDFKRHTRKILDKSPCFLARHTSYLGSAVVQIVRFFCTSPDRACIWCGDSTMRGNQIARAAYIIVEKRPIVVCIIANGKLHFKCAIVKKNTSYEWSSNELDNLCSDHVFFIFLVVGWLGVWDAPNTRHYLYYTRDMMHRAEMTADRDALEIVRWRGWTMLGGLG